VRQVHGEEVDLLFHTADLRQRLAEVDLRVPRIMAQRDKHLALPQPRLRQREVFIPLRHDPGHAQVDFGEALAEIGGVEQKIHFFAMDLPHSDACFVQAYRRRRRKRSVRATSRRSAFLAECRSRFCMTTPSLP